ncbi:HAD family hydrolase [Christensenella intestinihominis]|uniref:HAD family hydrolase n=2 Tax=Christensenella intestinihominis TaxID=1851429 RepID=UPI0015609EBB|nr:HAD family hydrolase [Christensenella intestinihominis]
MEVRDAGRRKRADKTRRDETVPGLFRAGAQTGLPEYKRKYHGEWPDRSKAIFALDGGIMLKYDHIMFDMDGTFVDSRNFHGLAFQRYFKQCGKDVDMEAVKDALGVTILDIFHRIGITGAEEEKAFDHLAEFYLTDADDLILEIPFGDRAKETFSALHEKGYRMSVVTNSFTELTEKILELHGIGYCFAEVAGADRHSLDKEQRCRSLLEKYGVDAGRALYVGDAERDIEIANTIGCDSCFADVPIGWAKDKRRVYEELKPTFTVQALDGLMDFL